MSARSNVIQLMRSVAEAAGCRCPAHARSVGSVISLQGQERSTSSKSGTESEYAFEMSFSNVRFGRGVTREIGMDLVNLGVKNVCVLTDKNISHLPPLSAVLKSIAASDVHYSVYDSVSIEPTDSSLEEAISFARARDFDGFVAVGGGSVMDSAKVANLYSCYPDREFLDFVNSPVGLGLPIDKTLKPLVCVPTTAGTGSETTGTAIFDYKPLQAKTGIAHRALRPTLGLVDPLHLLHMPRNVAIFSGFDVLCHALESYTALPFDQRKPRPCNPLNRPAYQGSNPISDIWALEALSVMRKYFKRSVNDPEDMEALSAMHLASMCAGVGFGNAGVHLPHGMSYPVSGLVTNFSSPGYSRDKALVPHGLSVVLVAPAVFEFTAPMCPERHLTAAELLGANISGAKKEDAGHILADMIRMYMQDMDIINGLQVLGYTSSNIPDLVKGTIPQHRVTKISPRTFDEEQLAKLFEASLTIY